MKLVVTKDAPPGWRRHPYTVGGKQTVVAIEPGVVLESEWFSERERQELIALGWLAAHDAPVPEPAAHAEEPKKPTPPPPPSTKQNRL